MKGKKAGKERMFKKRRGLRKERAKIKTRDNEQKRSRRKTYLRSEGTKERQKVSHKKRQTNKDCERDKSRRNILKPTVIKEIKKNLQNRDRELQRRGRKKTYEARALRKHKE